LKAKLMTWHGRPNLCSTLCVRATESRGSKCLAQLFMDGTRFAFWTRPVEKH
jgi:hypothetical protein